MSARRSAGGAAASYHSGGTCCSCTNISVMQLFHELKQQFPTVPDDVVNACIIKHCHDRPACHQQLEQAASAAIPRSLPCLQQHDHNRSLLAIDRYSKTNGMTTYDLNATSTSTSTINTEKTTVSDVIVENRSSTSKKYSQSNTKTNYEKQIAIASVDLNDTCANQNVNKIPEQQNEKNGATAIIKKIPATRPSTLNLTQMLNNSDNLTSVPEPSVTDRVNVSLNVNCSVNLGSNSRTNYENYEQNPRRHNTFLQVTPTPVWYQPTVPPCTENNTSETSPRSFTSVNLTLQTPTSDPQPIDIFSSPASGTSLTYTTSSFNSRQGLQSRLQITVEPGTGIGTVTAVRTKATPNNYPNEATTVTPNTLPCRTQPLPDIVHMDTSNSTKQDGLLSRQLVKKEQLRNELEAGKERLCIITKEVQALRSDNSLVSKSQLKKEIRHLQAQCKRLTQEVDKHSEQGSRVLLGEVNEDFYRHIYKGQHDSLRSKTQQQPQQLSVRITSVETDNEPHWQCHLCTFRNHPLMDKCEQCEMPRVLLGKKVNENFDDVLLRQQHATTSNSFLALGMNEFCLF